MLLSNSKNPPPLGVGSLKLHALPADFVSMQWRTVYWRITSTAVVATPSYHVSARPSFSDAKGRADASYNTHQYRPELV